MSASFDLDCTGCEVKAASIGHDYDGNVFRCTIGPLSETVLQHLQAAARLDGTIRIMFAQRPLVLVRVEVEQSEPRYARIVGRVANR